MYLGCRFIGKKKIKESQSKEFDYFNGITRVQNRLLHRVVRQNCNLVQGCLYLWKQTV